MITSLQSFTMEPSPMSPPVCVWECILTTHWAGVSKLTVSAPGYSRDCTSCIDGEFLGGSTCSFFYPAVLESNIRHSGYHSFVWKPACIPKIQDKLFAVDSFEGWRSHTSLYSPPGLQSVGTLAQNYHLWLLTLIWATSLRRAFQFFQIQVRLLKKMFFWLVSITVVNAESDMQAVSVCLSAFFWLMCSCTLTDPSVSVRLCCAVAAALSLREIYPGGKRFIFVFSLLIHHTFFF